MMKLRLAAPAVLIDLGRLDELAGIRADGDVLVIGATTHDDAGHLRARPPSAPLLAHAAAQVGDPQVRHRGTIGGSLVHADPAADLPMAVLACAAGRSSRSRRRREVAVDDFFAGSFETALAPDELLVEVRVPRRPDERWGYQKFVRRANDWAIVGRGGGRRRIVLANMGPAAAGPRRRGGEGRRRPRRRRWPRWPTRAPSPPRTCMPTRYRRHLARVLTGRALERRT